MGTLFADTDWDGDGTNREMVCRVVESRSGGDDDHVYYVPHFQYPDTTPPRNVWEHSSFKEVQKWHQDTQADLRQRPELQPPNGMQDTSKTIEIYEEALYPCLRDHDMDSIVEDNASPHNNETIRESHARHRVKIVGYEATPAEKLEIVQLIHEQCRHYRREQDKKAQVTRISPMHVPHVPHAPPPPCPPQHVM